MSKKIDVYGLTAEQITALRAVAIKKTGRDSLSFFAKHLLLLALERDETALLTDDKPSERQSNRLELKLPPTATRYLEKAAEQGQMTPNMVAVGIIMEHIDRHPVLSDHEANALYQSNYQLLRIGRNLNQIARQINAGEQVSLSWQQLNELMEFIRRHTEQANRVLQTRRRRLRK